MAPSRARATTLPFLLAMIFGVVLCILAAPAQASSASQPSPSADVDLICHTSNPDDCYPRVFQPSDEFQTVREDQELPNGLHVRLNIWTGEKEAKINVPDEVDPSLEGLPVDQAVVVVEPQESDAPPVPKGAPKYETAGKIKEPKPDYEAEPFFQAMKMLKSGESNDGKAFDVALEGMEDLSHDIYYGLKITEDPAVLKGLFCLMADQGAVSTDDTTPRDQQAAAILAGALQNNPTALKEVTKEWANIMEFKCPQSGKALSEGFYTSFMPSDAVTGADAKQSASKVKAKVAAINGLIKSDRIRAEFLKGIGMRNLLEVLVPEGKEWATAQRKVGQLVLDTFLDEDMGAKLGQWPNKPRSSDARCGTAEGQTEEGCWDYHVEKIMKANKRDSGHWSKDLSKRLAAARKNMKASGHQDSVCAHCLRPGTPRACSRCHAAAYCDSACQRAAWAAVHGAECKVLRRVAAQGRPGLPTPVRAVVQALLKPEIGDAMRPLEGHVEAWRRSGTWADMEMMAMGASAFAGLGTTQENVQKAIGLLCKIQTNAFHRYDADLGQVGIFLEPTLAMANHSCIPNAMVQFIGRKAILRAESLIQAGDEIEISYTDYTYPLSRRAEALSPYNFTCQCLRCSRDLNIYQVCAQSPNINLNLISLVSDPSKLRRHSASTSESKAALANKYSEDAVEMIDPQETPHALNERRRYLHNQYRKCQPLVREGFWGVSPLPQVLSEISIYYAEEGNFMYALAIACFGATSCDPYRHVAPFHPVRAKGLFLIGKLLANTAADTAALSASVEAMVSKGNFSQKALHTLQEIDQVSLCQMLLLMILQQTPEGYNAEWELSISASEMLNDINQLPGRDQELSLINAWRQDPSSDQSRAFFDYAVLKQVDALASLGHEILVTDFGR
ncbi:hypothetical protein EDB81DRAFT_845137 [Dactylonectria macrodidyma]|uniref:Nucleotide exchange factor SIL1 n=1 Tax=Dactylonectria macrodidyma TaxID=307937 RepID=A0A9P9EAL7_9HYPO|nr:hypothetical protein EDB81DRAFT_845137 [Dactylonectria macrodidyma]